MDNIYDFEQMITQRQNELDRNLRQATLLRQARKGSGNSTGDWSFAEVIQQKRLVLRLGRLMIIW